MKLGRIFGGSLYLELVDSNPLLTLLQAGKMGIVISHIRKIDDLTVRFRIPRNDFEAMHMVVRRRGGRLTCKETYGVYRTLRPVLSRPVLLFGLLVLAALTLYIPNRILFVEVVGNHTVEDCRILEIAAQCGMEFGASRRELRSEKVKNTLLEFVPQLQWIGVNTYGCRAVISVQERTAVPYNQSTVSVSSIIAAQDGVIQSITVSSGTPVCKPGQVVQKGDLLVSGYSDCGICIHGTKSEADILANTQRQLEAVSPFIYQKRVGQTRRTEKYSLVIGKKRINFYKGSGISPPTCGKMYEVKYVTLPGEFVLPIALITEIQVDTVVEDTTLPSGRNATVLSDFAAQYLKQNMVAGVIIDKSENLQRREHIDCLQGTYVCSEMIGRVRIEETIEEYEKTNRTYRKRRTS